MAEYDINEELNALVEAVVNDEFTDTLVENNVTVVACTKVKLDKETQEPTISMNPPVQLKKIGPLHNVYIPAKYILVMDYAFLKNENEVFHKAAISKALESILVEITEDGRVRLKKRPFDIMTFANTVVKHQLNGENEGVRDVLQIAGPAAAATTAKKVVAKKAVQAQEPEAVPEAAPETPPEEEEKPRVVSRMPTPAPARVAPPTLKPKVVAKPRTAAKPPEPEPTEEPLVAEGLEGAGEEGPEPAEEQEPMPAPPRRGQRPAVV